MAKIVGETAEDLYQRACCIRLIYRRLASPLHDYYELDAHLHNSFLFDAISRINVLETYVARTVRVHK